VILWPRSWNQRSADDGPVMRKWKVDVPGFVSELIVCRASEDWGVGGDSEWFLSAD
jgi:hypothetical protein